MLRGGKGLTLLRLDGSKRWLSEDIDPCQPLARPRADIPTDNGSERRAVSLGQRLAVHFPGEQDFISVRHRLSDGARNGVVVDLVLLEVRVGADLRDDEETKGQRRFVRRVGLSVRTNSTWVKSVVGPPKYSMTCLRATPCRDRT